MTMSIKTQCPHCQAIFNLPKNQLNKMDSKGRCGYCEQFFLLNEHIVTPENESPAAEPNIKPAKPLTKKPLSKEKSGKAPIEDIKDDVLIHDDMQIDEPQDNALDYEAFEDMDAWITQLDNTESVNPTIEPLAIDHHPDDSNKHVSENAWLESLLAEEKGEPVEHINIPKNDSSLSKLLTDIGIPTQDNSKKPQTPPAKKQEHSSSVPTGKRPLIATFLWALGSLMLTLLLISQYIFFNINTLIKNPEYKAQLQSVCEIIGCPLPNADINEFTITHISHSTSKISDGATFSDIKAVLVNQSVQSQLLPNIKVSIYEENTLIGEFIASPADYLLSPQANLAGEYDKPIMFTVPIAAKQINKVVMDAIY